jgi:hypothetical protein
MGIGTWRIGKDSGKAARHFQADRRAPGAAMHDAVRMKARHLSKECRAAYTQLENRSYKQCLGGDA